MPSWKERINPISFYHYISIFCIEFEEFIPVNCIGDHVRIDKGDVKRLLLLYAVGEEIKKSSLLSNALRDSRIETVVETFHDGLQHL